MTRTRLPRLPAVLALVLFCAVAGCSLDGFENICEEGQVYPEADSADDQAYRMLRVAEVLPAPHTKIDLLFVVDDSMSMADEQEQLGIWSSELFSVLSLEGELPDLHIAVLSSSLSVPGVGGCEAAPNGLFHTGNAYLGGDRFIRDVAGSNGRERNYGGDLSETFAALARVGDSGCGYEQPFEATRRALSGEVVGNDGFLRNDALLVVMFVSDEDDCSASDPSLFGIDPYGGSCSTYGPSTSYRCFEFGVRCDDGKSMRALGERQNCRPDEDSAFIAPVAPFADFLKDLKDHPGKVIVAGVYGKPNSIAVEVDTRPTSSGGARLSPSCESDTASAAPGVRINNLLSQFPARAAQSSICEPDLSWAMRNTALLTRDVANRSHCLAGAIADTSAAAGFQPQCSVEAIAGLGTFSSSTTAIPPCSETETERCFEIESDPSACAETNSQLAFRVSRPALIQNETLTVTCAVRDDRLVVPEQSEGNEN